MTIRTARWLALQAGFLFMAAIALGASPPGQTVPDLAHLPKFKSGIPMYPTPFLAIARTPHPIASPANGGMNIESDVGFLSGFSGFVDASNGNFGFPGYRNHAIANFAFDQDKLVIQAHVPDPEGRKLRATANGNLDDDDRFEVLLEPRTRDGRGEGKIYRIVGSAFGHWSADYDLQGIGQYHVHWDSGISYGSMLWDPTGGWMASVAIPWDKIGGKPADGDTWGVQFAVRYVDPKIVAYLSPTDDFTDASRFARIRFDFNRRLNYREHWLSEECKTGRFSVGYLLANGGETPQTMKVSATCYEGAKELGHDSFQKTCPPGASYWADNSNTYAVIWTHPASPTVRDTVAHIQVHDVSHDNTLIFDQWVPYWQMKPGERDWLKSYFGKEFSFNIGPYPSLGIFDYAVDAQTLVEDNKTAAKFECIVSADGKEIQRDSLALPADGKINRSIKLGKFTDGTTYTLQAIISDADGKMIAQHSESWTRHVMPFEKAPKAGLSDIVIPPFTAPTIAGSAVSCWNRTYKHGPDGLLESLIAANDNLLARPATFKAILANGQSATLTGDAPTLKPHGIGMVDYAQAFHGGGITLNVTGVFDYDGFYRFAATFGPDSAPVDIKELRLEIPIKSAHATLIDAAADANFSGGSDKSLGLLSTDTGRIWDSVNMPMGRDSRKSTMPPWLWIGDDDRGLCFSQQSDQGTHNDPKLPAAALDRSADAVTMTIWLVNKPFSLAQNQTFEFALQASPFKPMPTNWRLWRDQPRRSGNYKNGVYFTNFWNPANYPTYGRWITIPYLKKMADQDGCDRTNMEGSACSECSGTPEYEQFYYEWGSGMDQFKRLIPPVPADMLPRFTENGIKPDPFIMVEAFSNLTQTNLDYRVWWLSEAAKAHAASFVYQDNATWCYTDRPAGQFGYVRDDGGVEPTSAIWKSRTLAKRFATAEAEAGEPSSPGTYPNLMSPVLPGRSFCGKALTGEYTNSDQLRLAMLRVHLSQQWGIAVAWLCQSPSNAGAIIGTTETYWRALYSEILLFDITNFSRDDTAEVDHRWLDALDVFWLDDPSIKFHPYYRNDTLDHVAHPDTTFVSTYTATGRALAVISNQNPASVIETVAFKDMSPFGAAGLKYFYDGETGEEIETDGTGALKLFLRGHDYRVVLGYPAPWKFAAKNRLPNPDAIPAQSTLDARLTTADICKHLLTSRTLPPLSNAHRLTEAWAQQILGQLNDPSRNVVYLDSSKTTSVDLGDPRIQCSVFYDRAADLMLIGYFNDTDHERDLPIDARNKLAALVGKASYNYIYDAIDGYSQWSEIDVPAHGGRWEILTPDIEHAYGPRNGLFKVGTYMSNIYAAIAARKAEMEK
jgi:hypothetical protein